MALENNTCVYDPPAYDKDAVAKLRKSLPVIGHKDDSVTYPLPASIRRVINWGLSSRGEKWYYNSQNMPVCNLDTMDVDEVQDANGKRIFSASGSGLQCDKSLYAPLRAFLENTSYFSRTFGASLGSVSVLAHGGGLRTSNGKDSFHYTGSAIDIYWLGWKNGNVHTASRPCNGQEEIVDVARHRRLVAIEAGLRKWFSYVLARKIDGHQHHFHVDNGCPGGVALRVKAAAAKRPYESCHYFVQDCIRAFTDIPQEYTGKWDDGTSANFAVLLSDLGMERLDPVTNVNAYLLFLDYIMMHGFSNSRAGTYRWGIDVASVVT